MPYKDAEKDRLYHQKYEKANRQKRNAQARARYASGKASPRLRTDARRTWERAYRERNAESIKARESEYLARTAEHRRAQQASYREANRGKINARMREYGHRVKERTAVYQKAYATKNREHLSRERRRRYQENPEFRLRTNLRNRLNAAIRLGCRAGSAVRDLGCSIEEFINYIEARFEAGMSWENWGEWHLDHIRPLALFNLTNRQDFWEACHYTNMTPIWASDNLRKGVKIT